MARRKRVLLAGGVYHVYNRGVLKERIFLDDRDRLRFLRYLALCCHRFWIEIRSYCLMGNHFHLHVCTPLCNLSAAMHWLLGCYAMYVNRRYSGSGHVYETRFHSPVVQPGGAECGLSRYVHLNPELAKMVSRAADYEFSSYRYYLHPEDAPSWLRVGVVLAQFGRRSAERIARYREFVEGRPADVTEEARRYERVDAIGNDSFLAALEERREVPPPEPVTTIAAPEPGVVLEAVAESFGVDIWTLLRNERPPHPAKLAAVLTLSGLGFGYRRTGGVLGGVSDRTVARHLERVHRLARTDAGYRAKLAACMARFGLCLPR